VSAILFPVEGDPPWENFCETLFQTLGAELPGRCESTTYYARLLLESLGFDSENSLAYYRKYGGYCDCEILLNTAAFAVGDGG
jgi:hypothetical protein